MGFIELFILAIGLSMDAFAVSVCKGLSLRKINLKHMCIAGAWFGGFQALMPLIGYFLGNVFAHTITKYDHWIAFVLLLIIGGKMLQEAFSDEEDLDSSMSIKTMFFLAVATSIDALAVGISMAFLRVNILSAVSTIGVTTFILASIGVLIGNKFGVKYKDKATIAGGVILILIGAKILLEHLGIIA